MKIVATALLAFCAAACTTLAPAPQSFRGTVTAHHNWAAGLPRQFVVVPQGEQINSIAFAQQRQNFESQLSRWAFVPLTEAEAKQNSSALKISFKTDSSKQTVTHTVAQPSPFYGSVGLGWNRPNVGVGINLPVYPFPPVYESRTQTREIILPSLSVTIDTAEGKRVYEGKITLSGAGNTPLEALPRLVDGLMQNFPGESGKATAVVVQ